MMASRELKVNVAIVGGGPTGCIAARLFADAGFSVALIAPAEGRAVDHRTTALLHTSWCMIRALGLDARIGEAAQPLRAIRLIDDTESLLRAPETVFLAREIGLDAFGYNVPNQVLIAALGVESANVERLYAICTDVALSPSGCLVETTAGPVHAALVVGADGRDSLVRDRAGIKVTQKTAQQAALVTTLTHSASHEDTSVEFHTRTGPYTLVPVSQNKSAVVCVVGLEQAKQLSALTPEQLARECERRSHWIFGSITHCTGGFVFPLRGLLAARMAGQRTALVGEAAHVIPPIGAQGLNLGLRDVAHLVEIATHARERGEDIGAPPVLARYMQSRAMDVRMRAVGVDWLNRSLLTDFFPAHMARAGGLAAITAIPPLRRLLMRAGLAPPTGLPRIMRESHDENHDENHDKGHAA